MTSIHNPQTFDELSHETHIVPDEDHRGTDLGLDISERFHHLALNDYIKSTGQFVGEPLA